MQAVAVVEDSPEEAAVEDTPDEEDVIEVRPTHAAEQPSESPWPARKRQGPFAHAVKCYSDVKTSSQAMIFI